MKGFLFNIKNKRWFLLLRINLREVFVNNLYYYCHPSYRQIGWDSTMWQLTTDKALFIIIGKVSDVHANFQNMIGEMGKKRTTIQRKVFQNLTSGPDFLHIITYTIKRVVMEFQFLRAIKSKHKRCHCQAGLRSPRGKKSAEDYGHFITVEPELKAKQNI